MMKKIPMQKIMNCLSSSTKVLAGPTTLLACLMLASCSGMANYYNSDSQKRNQVEMIKIPYMINFPSDSSDLSDTAIKKLDMFMMKSNVSYGDELSIDFPLNRDGSLSEGNQKRMTFLSGLLKKRGLHLSPDVTPYGMSPTTDQARLLISRYVVTPPLCGDWSQPSTGNYENMNLPDFGCSTQANLGLMIANPRDLITGVDNGVPDSERAAKAVHAYRTKKPAKVSSGKAKK
ncbi:MAG: hypothetical protein JKY45_07240 [Emcibacter sp.]|nr:hypothetical protein [Emcibacter sp.]